MIGPLRRARQPSGGYDAVRRTRMLQGEQRHDVIVIGGGVVGVCAAYYLAKAGRKVVLLEQREVGAGASTGNAGLVVPSHVTPLASPGVIAQGLRWMLDPESPFYIKPRPSLALLSWLWRFRAACTKSHVERVAPLLRELHRSSQRLYEVFSRVDGMAFGFEKRGLLDLFVTDRGFESGRAEAAHLAALGIDAQVLTADETRRREPAANDRVIGGVYFGEDSHLDPARFLQALDHRIAEMGVERRTQTRVVSFERNGRRVCAAQTTNGRFTADQYVLAAGAWSQTLGRTLGLKVPIQPAKGYSLSVPRIEGLPDMPLRLAESKVAVTPMGEFVRFAGTLELAGMDLSINARRVNAIRRAAGQYLTLAGRLERVQAWCGLRPCTPDGLPLLGRPKRFDNLILAAGHAMIGQSLGPVTGQIVADLADGVQPSVEIDLLDPDRFS